MSDEPKKIIATATYTGEVITREIPPEDWHKWGGISSGWVTVDERDADPDA